ncbi:STAS domain-containing protein [Umezawaea sp. NPDC059074]|uniref:STAS domain-containing protein n=1 Tax=Umezawaea sp. NPDC059074 TaxID=3346716 RepID=UPI0036CA0F58
MKISDFGTTVRRQGDSAVVVLRGELDSDTAQAVLDAGDRALATAPTTVCLDCAGLTFFGSAGIRTLLDLRDACHAKNAAFRLVATPRRVLRPLEITGVLGEFVIDRDVPAAC